MLFCNFKLSVNSKLSRKGAEKDNQPQIISNAKCLPCLLNLFCSFDSVNEVSATDTKRISQFVSSKKSCEIASCSAPSGSITLECACVLPLFLFFCIQILSILSVFALHSSIEAAIHQEVSQAAVQLYAMEKVEENFISDTEVINQLIVNIGLPSKIKKRIGEEYLNRSLIQGGSSGIHVAICPGEADNQDVVDIVLAYKIKPLVDILGFSEFSMANRCRMKIWSGYNIDDQASIDRDNNVEEMVYVAETGVVYHLNSSCSYLNPTISNEYVSNIGNKRNLWGEKYYPCEICGYSKNSNIYITEQGNRYHSKINCSGLKRTVSRLALSEAIKRGLGPCSRCG